MFQTFLFKQNSVTLCLVCVGLVAGLTGCGGKDARSDTRPEVLAFYYPWYGNPDVSGSWIHWNSDGHDPDRARADGLPDIAAPHVPELGAYDSADPAVIARHIEWSERAGIDGWIISWWGVGNREDGVVDRIAYELESRGCPLRFTIYHEQVPQGGADALVAEIELFLAHHASNPCLFRPHGRPLLFAYFRSALEGLPVWAEAKPRLPGVEVWGDFDPIFVRLVFESASIFDGFHTYNPWPQLVEGGVQEALRTYEGYGPFLTERGKPFALTVLPGYDDTVLDRSFTWKLDREEGETYRSFIQGALALHPEFLLITSFNEWHEGSQIEPGLGYGDLYLDLTRELTGR